jgi:hypothetical protein
MSAFNLHSLSLALRIAHPDLFNMAPATPRPAQKKARQVHSRSRRHRIDKRSSPRSPRTVLAHKKPRIRGKRRDIANPSSERASMNHKTSKKKVSPRIVKYKIASQRPSSEPFEKVRPQLSIPLLRSPRMIQDCLSLTRKTSTELSSARTVAGRLCVCTQRKHICYQKLSK